MGYSKTYIANQALLKLGELPTSNTALDSRKAADTIDTLWDMQRDVTLQSALWCFATKRARIAVNGETPLSEWSYQYTLPNDYIRIHTISSNGNFSDTLSYGKQYVREGRQILTNYSSPIYIKYVYRITDTSAYDPIFCEALACKLAFEACESITQSNTKKDELSKQFDKTIAEAHRIDSVEIPTDELPEDRWVLSRVSYSNEIDYNA